MATNLNCIAYLGENGELQDWHGKQIGTYKITHTWKTPRSWVSGTQNQVCATVNDINYEGCSAGVNMLFRGKRTKQ